MGVKGMGVDGREGWDSFKIKWQNGFFQSIR